MQAAVCVVSPVKSELPCDYGETCGEVWKSENLKTRSIRESLEEQ